MNAVSHTFCQGNPLLKNGIDLAPVFIHGHGTKFLPFPQSVMEACFNAANELYTETNAKNPRFKKVFDSWKPFRNEEVLWFRVVENTLDSFMARLSAANKL